MTENLNVFIVDDEPNVIEWLSRNVEWDVYGCMVTGCFTEAQKLLQSMEESPADIILTDISMPGMTGLELIRRVKERFPDTLIIVISAYDKFEYVKEAFRYGIIDYCLKPIDMEELRGCIKSAVAAHSERLSEIHNQDSIIFRNSVFLKLISGESNSYRLDEQCELAGITLNAPVYQVALLDTADLEKNECMLLMKQFSQMEEEGVFCFLDGSMNLVFLFMNREGFDRSMEDRIHDILRREGVLYRYTLYIGKPLESYRKIASSYQTCCDFLQSGFLFSKRIVRTQQYPYEKYQNPFAGREFLVNGIKSNKPDSIIQAAERLSGACTSEYEKSRELMCVAVFLTRTFCLVHPNRTGEMKHQKPIDNFSATQLLKWIEDFANSVLATEKAKEQFYHPYVNFCMQKVSSDYGNAELSLQELARDLHISSTYLGRLFKTQTGSFFNDYLLKVRLEMSVRLLLEQKYQAGEIAALVGFSNQSYFNKMFRREYGVTPMKYRCKEERNRQDE